MNIYLVGGAVRDKLLGLAVKERDWVVVGSSPEEMLQKGFKPVGKDFPVFLHPKTHEEYALARTERKTGVGYKGFHFHASPTVTLEEDLLRRDLTINAIAETPDSQIIDPYNGHRDLSDKILRHVSPAFIEDPLRVLRVARFMARLGHLNFQIAKETLDLMKKISLSGELKALTPERIWQEVYRALCEPQPHLFFTTLEACHALKSLFPELAALRGIPANPSSHPEIDSWQHNLLVMQMAAKLSDNPIIRFSALVHDLGKAKTPIEQWPKHHEHCKNGVALVKALCERYKIPNSFKSFALIATEYHIPCHKIESATPEKVVDLLEAIDVFRHPERLEWLILLCEADTRGRIGYETITYPQANFLKKAYEICKSISAKPFVEKGLTGIEIKKAIREARVKSLEGLE